MVGTGQTFTEDTSWVSRVPVAGPFPDETLRRKSAEPTASMKDPHLLAHEDASRGRVSLRGLLPTRQVGEKQ